MLDTANTKVLSWLRQAPGAPAVFISVNFTAEPQIVSLNVPFRGKASVETLLKSPGGTDLGGVAGPIDIQRTSVSIQLGPYGVYIGEVQ